MYMYMYFQYSTGDKELAARLSFVPVAIINACGINQTLSTYLLVGHHKVCSLLCFALLCFTPYT